MSPSKIEHFECRLEEGFDISTDSLYLEWKELKLKTTSTQLSSSLSSNSSPSDSPAQLTSPAHSSTPPFS